MTGMCPYCGDEVALSAGGGLTVEHGENPSGGPCEGSMQVPRCAESDARPLWNGQPNRRFRG